jgi:hypothetical protein
MFALAPIARIDHMVSPIGEIAPFVDEVSVSYYAYST